jgi:hypothetical protein
LNIPPISEDEDLIRHIAPEQWPPELDKPMATAFKKERLSVDRQQLRGVDVCCRLRPDWGFVAFSVKTVIDLGLTVEPNPLGIDGVLPALAEPSLTYNPAHALVLGHKSKSTYHKLRDAAGPLVRPGGCSAL